MSVGFEDSIGVLAQSWLNYHKNKDINIEKISLNNMSDWVVKNALESVA